MQITMEQIDELRKRTNCSYEEAKSLLEKHNGSVLEAIVELEKKQRFNNNDTNEGKSFFDKLKALVRKGFQTRFVILNKNETILNLSINFMILVFIFAIHLAIIGLVVALFMGYTFRIRKNSGCDIDVDKIISNVTDKVKKTANDIVEDTPEKKTQSTDKGYNEVTVE